MGTGAHFNTVNVCVSEGTTDGGQINAPVEIVVFKGRRRMMQLSLFL